MLPLPGNRPEAFQTLSRKVQTDHCVAVDTNRYSVSPRHVGRPATVHLFSQRLEILVDGEVIAVHARSEERYGRHVLPEHEEEFKRHTPSRRLLEQAFLRLGPAAEPFYEGLKVRRGGGAGHHMKRLLNLADRHGTNAVVAAMAQVTRYTFRGPLCPKPDLHNNPGQKARIRQLQCGLKHQFCSATFLDSPLLDYVPVGTKQPPRTHKA